MTKSEIQANEEKKARKSSSSSEIIFDDKVQKLQQLIANLGIEMHPMMNEKNDCCDNELELREENYFGRLSEIFIEKRLLKKSGDYMISRTHNDNFRFSLMSENYQIYHLSIIKFDGIYSFENAIYPLATSLAGLIHKCIQSPMNILSAILQTNVILRHFINPNINDKSDYNIIGLFLNENDIIKKDNLIARGKIADCFVGRLFTRNKCEQVIIKIMHKYNHNELNKICQELHISNVLRRFTAIESIVAAQCVQIFQSPYMIIYPFMNCGSYQNFAQRMGQSLSFKNKIEAAQTIAHALSDMHFLGLLHCNIGARNIFVRKELITSSKVKSYSSSYCYKYYLGDFRDSHIGKIKEVKPKKLRNIRWLAPEVFKTKQLTECTDVFAFGITLYEIFTGNLPYFSMSVEEIQSKLIAGHRIRPEIRDIKLPRNVLKLMRRCWRTDVSERPTMNGIWLELRAIRNSLIFKQQYAKFNFQQKTI
ncbi:Protein tyrosine kinase family protein [Brugia pahangi]